MFHISENGSLLLKREAAKARGRLRHKQCNALLHYRQQGIRDIQRKKEARKLRSF